MIGFHPLAWLPVAFFAEEAEQDVVAEEAGAYGVPIRLVRKRNMNNEAFLLTLLD